MGKSKQQRFKECEAANRIIRETAEKINRLANAPLATISEPSQECNLSKMIIDSTARLKPD